MMNKERKQKIDFKVDIKKLQHLAETIEFDEKQKQEFKDKISLLRNGGRVEIDFRKILEEDKKTRQKFIYLNHDKIEIKFNELKVGDWLYYGEQKWEITKIEDDIIYSQNETKESCFLFKDKFEECAIKGKLKVKVH